MEMPAQMSLDDFYAKLTEMRKSGNWCLGFEEKKIVLFPQNKKIVSNGMCVLQALAFFNNLSFDNTSVSAESLHLGVGTALKIFHAVSEEDEKILGEEGLKIRRRIVEIFMS